MKAWLYRLAAFLARPGGFAVTLLSIAAWVPAGIPSGFSEAWLLAFNLYLSVLAIIEASVILVAQARGDVALHAKLDELIRATPADNRLRGIERQDCEPPS